MTIDGQRLIFFCQSVKPDVFPTKKKKQYPKLNNRLFNIIIHIEESINQALTSTIVLRVVKTCSS